MNTYRKFLNYIDFAFEILIILLITFIWSKYFINDSLWALITTSTLTFLIALMLVKRKKIKIAKALNISITNTQKENFKNYFLYLSSKSILEHIQKQIGGQISPTDDNMLFNNDCIYILIRKFKDITKDDILSYIQNLNTTKIAKITLLCISIEPECENFLKNISNIHFEIENLDTITNKYYKEILKDNSYSNQCKIHFKQNPIITFKMFLLMILRPQNAKGYFFSALILVFASIIVPQKLYYYIFASILLLLAFTSKLLKSK